MKKITQETTEIELLNLMQQARKLNNILKLHKDNLDFYEIEHVVSMLSEPIILRFNQIVQETHNDSAIHYTFLQVTETVVEGYEELRQLAQYVSSEVSTNVRLDSLTLAKAAANMFPIFGDNGECSTQHLVYGLKAMKNGTLNPMNTNNFEDYYSIGLDRETQSAICMGERRDNILQYQYYERMEREGSPYNMPFLDYGSRKLISEARTIYRDSNMEISKQCWLLIQEAQNTINCDCCKIIPTLLENVGLDETILE